MGRLLGLLTAAAEGRGQAVLVEGEPGIGKTRLLDEALAYAAPLGVRVFRSRAEELDCRRPFGAIADCLGVARSSPEPRHAGIARLVFRDHADAPNSAEGGPASGDGRRGSESWLVEAFVALVEDLCARGPVAVVVDDLQWADPATLVVLHRLGRLAGELPLFVLGACRPSLRPAPLARLRQSVTERGSPSIVLEPLGPDAVAQLVEEMLGVEPGPRLVRQAASAGGNPFFVTELVAALRASGSITIEDGRAEIGAVAMPPALKLTILHRMSFLSADTLDVLRMASILGSSFSVRDLTVVLGRSALELAPGLREAIDAGVLGDVGSQIAFRHDLLREALYEDIPPALRVSLHRDAGQALAGAGAPAVEVAEHFVRGATPGDAIAVAWLLRAADDVTVHGPTVAADLLSRVIELIEPGAGRDVIMADWVVSLEMAGRLAEAEAVGLDLLGRKQEPRTEARLRLCLARQYRAVGRMFEAIEQANQAMQVEGLSDGQKARTLANGAQLYLFLPDLSRAAEITERALAMATEAHDQVAAAIAAYNHSTIALRRGRLHEALDWAVRARVVEADAHPTERMAHGWQTQSQAAELAFGAALIRLDRLDEALDVLTDARRGTEELGFKRLSLSAHRFLMIRDFMAGEWDDAVAEFDATVDLRHDCGERSPAAIDASGVRALIAVHRGDLKTAATLTSMTGRSRDDDRGSWYVLAEAHLAEAHLAEASGTPETVLAIVSQAWDYCAQTGNVADFAVLGPLLVRAALSVGDDGRATAVTDAVGSLADANEDVASAAGDWLWCRGLLHADAAILLEASDAYRRSGRPLYHALASEDAADVLGRDGRLDEARRLFESAIAGYDRLGATWDARRAASRMRALGMRRGRRGTRGRPSTGWAALTPGELAVVELVAAGMSNPDAAEQLFLSRRTVKAHVSSALSKLGMSSRVELAREATKRQAEPRQPAAALAVSPTAPPRSSARR